MTIKAARELLADLLQRGSAIGVVETASVYVPAVAEILNGKLFWVNRFATDNSGAHAIEFDKTEAVGTVGLSFYKGVSVVAYVAPYVEWPSLDNDDVRAEEARWKSYLKDRENKAAFSRFVDLERSLRTEGE